MNTFITKSMTGIILSLILFAQPVKSQSIISGQVFSDNNHNGYFDPGEGLQGVTVWLLDNAAVSPYYLVYPVQISNTSTNGDYTFKDVNNGNYQIRVIISSVSHPMLDGSTPYRYTGIMADINPYTEDNSLDGSTDLNITSSNTFDKIDFVLGNGPAAPDFTPKNRFVFNNSANSFINVTSQTYSLDAPNCGIIPNSPTITFTTDKQCNVSSQTYPQAGNEFDINGMDWPGSNKGGFYPDDITFQMFFGQDCYSPGNNDKVTLTVDFSNMVNNVRFTIYDIDCVNPQMVDGSIDHVTVTGYNGSNPVMPVIFLRQERPFNSISGNSISGWANYPDNNPVDNYPDALNSGNADNGNANIYFPGVINKIVIEYEEYAPVLIPSVKKVLVPVSPINDESQWGEPINPSLRGISIGSIGYSLYCKTLAASLVSFDARAAGQQVKLQWKMDNEEGVRQYGIERLSENGSWARLGNIKAGTAEIYQYTDKHPVKGMNQYRLVMEGADGSYRVSDIRTASVSSTANDLEIVNNPASALKLVVYGDPARIEVYDISGHPVFDSPIHNTSPSAGMNMSFDQLRLTAGVYIVKALFTNGETKMLKFVKW